MKTTSLDLACPDTAVAIVEIKAGEEAKRKLLAMGLHVGDAIIKLNHPRWSPVLIRNLTTHSSKIAIGQGLARKILVRDARP
ncbi:MAG: ferrous iron transport protein A [Acidobacteria bacterium]|jgi:Fe2+ transport system protein FeoA|nr:ferrous iron transport protein A [Acidobacteriota bacterium]